MSKPLHVIYYAKFCANCPFLTFDFDSELFKCKLEKCIRKGVNDENA